MLDRLPVELLTHIVRLASPVEYTAEKHKERCRLLKTLCLTSRVLCDVAQPLLPEVFVAKPATALELLSRLTAARPDGSKRVRVQVLVLLGWCERAVAGIEAVLRACSSVEELQVEGCSPFNVICLKHVPRKPQPTLP
ncbi:hypothetical protein JCM6882_001817 [Rhodosporidiobolus microsporus]